MFFLSLSLSLSSSKQIGQYNSYKSDAVRYLNELVVTLIIISSVLLMFFFLFNAFLIALCLAHMKQFGLL